MIRSVLKLVFLSVCMMWSHQLWSDGYDPLLLRAQASIFPKIVLLDQDIANKIVNNEVVITIVSTSQDISVAKQLKKTIDERYRGSLGGNNLIININTFDNFNQNSLSTAYILLQGSGLLFEKVVAHASSNDRIVFSYSYTDFKFKSLISLYVKEKTYIYVNKSTVQMYGISFLPVFYKIIKII